MELSRTLEPQRKRGRVGTNVVVMQSGFTGWQQDAPYKP